MEWLKLSTKLPRDPKWKLLSPRAKATYIEWACEVAEQETDGIYYCSGKTQAHVSELVSAGLVVSIAEGYELPAFLKWNKTRAEMDSQREARRRAGAIGGSKRSSKRLAVAHDTSIPEVEVEVEEPTTSTQHLAPRKRDALFEAVAEVCGINRDELTPSGRGSLNKAVAMLRGVGATAADVTVRAGNWPYEVPITPPGLAKHWPALGAAKPLPTKARGANRHLAALADKLEER